MKLTLYQFEQHLKQQLSPVYLITGDEPLLKQDAWHLLRQAAARHGFHERIRLPASSNFNWEELYTWMHAPSLLDEQRLLELDFRDQLPSKIASQILENYQPTPQLKTLVALDLPKLDDKIYRSGWFKNLEKIAINLTLWPIGRDQLPQWIQQRAKKHNVVLTHDAINALIELIEGNLSAAAQAIEKMALLQSPKPINAALVTQLLSTESHYSVFDLTDSLISREPKRSLDILNSLQADNVEVVIIIWALARELRLLVNYHQALAEGKTFDSIMQKHRIFSKRHAALKSYLKSSTLQKCEAALHDLHRIDTMAKGLRSDDPWQALTILCLKLSTLDSHA